MNSSLPKASFVLAFCVTLLGLANVMPAVAGFRIGPFDMAWFRPVFLVLSVWLLVVTGMEKTLPGRRRLLGAFHVLLALAMMYFCWRYYLVNVEIDDAMFLFDTHERWVSLGASFVCLYFCWRIWGASVAALGIIGIVYLVTGPYWPGPLATMGGDLNELLGQNLWFSYDTGILGATFSIVLTTVFPFIVLGAILEGVGAGDSMIRVAFNLMRKTRGGPAHAAVLASALFGSVSGSAVANVVGTGVITIPMIRKRGFNANFAGAVEAAASTGGQIMPPIMGAAALVLADYVGVSYLTVIVAILVPAIAYYISLFVMIMFESRRLGIVTGDEADGIGVPTRQDYLNLLLVFGPLALIVVLLIAGLSASGASISAIALLFPLSLVNPAVRAQPVKLLHSLANGGQTFARLLMAIAAVGIVISTLSATGAPVKFGVVMSHAVGHSLLLALFVVSVGCVLLGMGMPTLPAYVTVAAIALPSMQSLGLEPLTAHMFVFMIAVASTITPPVAIAAYAAASISGGTPIATGFTATRLGILILAIPFAFAYQPLLLTVEQAGGVFNWPDYLLLLASLAFAIYLAASALIGCDREPISKFESLLRLVAAVMLMSPIGYYSVAGALTGIALLLWHRRVNLTGASVRPVE